jgi:hypothetical protein
LLQNNAVMSIENVSKQGQTLCSRINKISVHLEILNEHTNDLEMHHRKTSAVKARESARKVISLLKELKTEITVVKKNIPVAKSTNVNLKAASDLNAAKARTARAEKEANQIPEPEEPPAPNYYYGSLKS